MQITCGLNILENDSKDQEHSGNLGENHYEERNVDRY
jgi:hypothetical protein